MSKLTLPKMVHFHPNFAGTSCPSGAFDTSSSLDADAAVFRNRTWTTTTLVSEHLLQEEQTAPEVLPEQQEHP